MSKRPAGAGKRGAVAASLPSSIGAGPVGANLAEAEALVTHGELAEASVLIDALLQADPADAGAWFQQARLLAARGEAPGAMIACGRAFDLWPDIAPLCQLMVALAAAPGTAPDRLQAGRLALAEQALLAATPDDALLHNRIAARLSAAGDLRAALPHLRIAAPALGHRDSALWNYTSALSLTGGHHELLGTEPLLRALAREVPSPFAPYVHLANARLALHHDRAALLAQRASLVRSSRWLDVAGLAALLERSLARRRPLGMILLSPADARLATYASRQAARQLDPDELSAVANSVWTGWFGTPIESAGSVAAQRFASLLLAGLLQADVVGLPDGALLEAEPESFGFLAELQSVVLQRPDRHFTPPDIMVALHDAMPFLRPLLAGQRFLGHVGGHPDLADRLARFCRIAETRTWLLPAPPDRHATGGQVLDRLDQVLETLAVPFEGALFMVGAGPLGVLCTAQIRALGGIAIPVDTVMDRWMAQ